MENSALECQVCLDYFDSDRKEKFEIDKRPRLISKCGHSVCTSCLFELLGRGVTKCPSCATNSLDSRDINSYAINITLVGVIENMKNQYPNKPSAIQTMEITIACAPPNFNKDEFR